MLKTNVGSLDRTLRIVAGIALLAMFFLFPGHGYRLIYAVLGVILLGTGLFSTCPVYSVLGVNTCATGKS